MLFIHYTIRRKEERKELLVCKRIGKRIEMTRISALCCVLENYQTEEGLNVPEVLRKYIPGQPEFLPFVKELPKDSTSLKAKGKAEMKGGSAPKIPGEGEVVERPKAVAEEKRS